MDAAEHASAGPAAGSAADDRPETRPGPEFAPVRRGGLRWFDIATLIAVVAVVVLISIPRLADFARRENQEDAVRLVRRLFQVLEARGDWSHPVKNVRALIDAAPPVLARQLDDQEFQSDGELLKRHGYLFDIAHVRAADQLADDQSAILAVRAWPWHHGRTGLPAFLALSSTSIFEHENPPPHWSGTQSRPPPPPVTPQELARQGWRRIAQRD